MSVIYDKAIKILEDSSKGILTKSFLSLSLLRSRREDSCTDSGHHNRDAAPSTHGSQASSVLQSCRAYRRNFDFTLRTATPTVWHNHPTTARYLQRKNKFWLTSVKGR